MAYATAALTSATPSDALSDVLKTLVGGAGVQNWSFIENIPAGTGAAQSGSSSYSIDVFKCSGSGADANDAGHDWYIGITRYGASTSFRVLIAENYNSTDKTFAGWPGNYVGKSGYPNIDENGYYVYSSYQGASYQKASYIFSYGDDFNPTLNTTGFTYRIKLNNNFILFSFVVGATETFAYLGLMDSLVDDSIGDPLPLCIVSNSDSSPYTTSGAFIRLPGIASMTSGTDEAFGITIVPWLSYSNRTFTVSNNTDYWDLWLNSGVPVSRVLCSHSVTYTLSPILGKCRGLLKEGVLCFCSGGTLAVGDTVTITDDATPIAWTYIGSLTYCALIIRTDD